jgi:hypothetical protein
MVAAGFAETLDNFQRLSRLNPETQSYTLNVLKLSEYAGFITFKS